MKALSVFSLLVIHGFHLRAWEHEHTAIHIDDLDTAIANCLAMGFSVAKQTDNVCFMQKGQNRFELMEPDWAPEHEAFATEDARDFREAAMAIKATTGEFEVLENTEEPEFCQLLFRHIGTDAVLQLVWRQKPVFANVFGEDGVEP